MKSPFFTIIISVFNKKDLLSKGINNIFFQTFRDYEIILIDDGSSDGSEKICNDLKEKYKQIRVIHQRNQGLGLARNIGIKNAEGKYICFYDIDDNVTDIWLEEVYNIVEPMQPDVLVYSYKEINLEFKTETQLRFRDFYLKSNHEIKNIYPSELSGLRFNNGFAWNKVYKRDFLIKNDIKFPSLRIQQDEVFNHLVYRHATSMVISSRVLYDYYVYNNGNTRNSFISDRLNIFQEVKDSFFKLTRFWKIRDPKLNSYIHSRFIKNVLYNRNPKQFENTIALFHNIISNESILDSARYLYNYPEGLSSAEKIYIKGIIGKSIPVIYLAETLVKSVSFCKYFLRKILK